MLIFHTCSIQYQIQYMHVLLAPYYSVAGMRRNIADGALSRWSVQYEVLRSMKYELYICIIIMYHFHADTDQHHEVCIY